MPVSADSLTAILQGAYPDATHIVRFALAAQPTQLTSLRTLAALRTNRTRSTSQVSSRQLVLGYNFRLTSALASQVVAELYVSCLNDGGCTP